MAEFVLDASALVALIRKETGWENVERCLPTAIISAVNFCETVYILRRRGMPLEVIREVLTSLCLTQAAFDRELAYSTASLVESTREQGLSLGDCACLALAHSSGAAAVTAEQCWNETLVGIRIQRIR